MEEDAAATSTSGGVTTTVRILAFPGRLGLPPIQLKCVDELPLSLGLLLVEEEHEDWTGLQVWPGAYLLLAYLAQEGLGSALLKGRGRIVELGCGTGAVGLALRPRFEDGATVILTDGHPELVTLAAENAALNGFGEGVVARRLLWGDGAEAREQLEDVRRELRGGRADLVVAADTIYDAEVLQPLLWTAAQLLKGPEERDHIHEQEQRTPAFVLSYCGRCLLSDGEFDRRIHAAAAAVGQSVVSITNVDEKPRELVGGLEGGMATKLREANARVFVFELARRGFNDGGGKPNAT